jgi:hypothetical protein
MTVLLYEAFLGDTCSSALAFLLCGQRCFPLFVRREPTTLMGLSHQFVAILVDGLDAILGKQYCWRQPLVTFSELVSSPTVSQQTWRDSRFAPDP